MGVISMEKYKCDKCGKEFNSEDALAQHKKDYDHSKLESEEEGLRGKVPSPRFDLNKWKNDHGTLLRLVGIVMVIGVISAAIFLPNWGTSVPEEEIVSRNGLHSHVDLDIEIHGQERTIPINVGIGAREEPIHTHTERNVIHLEFSGLVTRDDIRLGRFFEIWGKKFTDQCIFDKCTGSGGELKMLVNGERNNQFEDYVMENGDVVEIIFE